MNASKYDNALQEGRELTAESRKFRPALFRDELITAVLESINGVASGLKNTG